MTFGYLAFRRVVRTVKGVVRIFVFRNCHKFPCIVPTLEKNLERKSKTNIARYY